MVPIVSSYTALTSYNLQAFSFSSIYWLIGLREAQVNMSFCLITLNSVVFSLLPSQMLEFELLCNLQGAYQLHLTPLLSPCRQLPCAQQQQASLEHASLAAP